MAAKVVIAMSVISELIDGLRFFRVNEKDAPFLIKARKPLFILLLLTKITSPCLYELYNLDIGALE